MRIFESHLRAHRMTTHRYSRWLILSFSTILCQFVFAQKADDEVILKSGTVLYGAIDSIQRDTLFFKIGNRLPVSFAMSDVHQIQSSKKRKDRLPKTRESLPDSGFFFMGSIHAGLRATNANGRFGYRFSPVLQPIVSTSLSRYYAAGASFVQCMGGLTGNFENNLYYLAEAGYGFNITTSEQFSEDLLHKEGGYAWAMELGIRKWDKPNSYIYQYGLRFISQQAQFEYNQIRWNSLLGDHTVHINEKIGFRRVVLTLGFLF